MKAIAVVLDTNLLVLLIVGTTSKTLISKHKRTRAYTEEDFGLLTRILARFPEIVVTPNILTEASNLCSQVTEPTRASLLATVSVLVDKLIERYVPSADARVRPEFLRLGLADAATIQDASDVRCVLTDDLDLYLALHKAGRVAYNFNHIRLGAWEGVF